MDKERLVTYWVNWVMATMAANKLVCRKVIVEIWANKVFDEYGEGDSNFRQREVFRLSLYWAIDIETGGPVYGHS